MGTAFAGIVRTPLTSVIMIFEMTRDYSIIVPLMISNLISFAISRKLQPEPIYEALALQEGVYLPAAEGREETEGTRVSEVMTEKAPLLSLTASLDEARILLDREGSNAWPVGLQDRVAGIVTRAQIERAGVTAAKVGDLVGSVGGYAYVHPDQTAAHALERMRDAGIDVLPVVSRAGIGKMLGVVTRAGILAAYGVPSARVFTKEKS
jgi:CIC family chloride channel protein